MRRMPIRLRIAPFSQERCLPCVYAVLDGVSADYPPVEGRLHTCYSPVRRSPADESKLSSPLPLDLHVLSLSLAFILSQDQTLRCLSIILLFLLLRKGARLIDKLFCCVCLLLAVSTRPPLRKAVDRCPTVSLTVRLRFLESTKSLLFSATTPERTAR